MMPRIVYTRPDGGVNVCQPSEWAIAWLANGGFWRAHPEICVDEQVERSVAQGRYEYAVRRYIRAMDKGGCTTAEAWEIIKDRDCGHLGSGFEVWSIGELPDRWFRDAWRRSANGGPISIDIRAARKIQFQRIGSAIADENKRRSEDLDRFDLPVEIPMGPIRDRLHKASDPDEIRRIWPQI